MNDIVVIGHRSDLALQFMRQPEVIAIEESQEVAGRVVYSGVSSGGAPVVSGKETSLTGFYGREALDYLDRVIGRRVINHYDFMNRIRLCQDAIDGRLDRIRAVSDRDDNGN